MSEKIFKTAIVGCGGIAQQHSAVLEKMENVRVVATCDTKPERAEKLAAKHGAKAYTDVHEMLEKERIDVLHITTPHPLHTPIACLAAEKGVNVLTEKPPAAFREQWADFESLPQKGIRVGVCFQNRFNGSVREMKRILDAGELGNVLGARAMVYWVREEDYYAGSDWRGSWTTEGGGALINQSIHTLDLMVYLLGHPVLLGCSMANRHLKDVIEVEDTVDAAIDFHGARGLFFATTAYCEDAPVEITIVCEKGKLEMKGDTLRVTKDGEVTERDYSLAPLPGKSYWGTGHTACLSAFYQSLENGTPFINDPAGVKETMQLMYDMYEGYRDVPTGKLKRW